MKILFEDSFDEALPSLYRKSLPPAICAKINYANGNGNIPAKAEEMLQDGSTVLVLLDTIPANKAIRDIYMELRHLSRQYGYRLIVWNIVCAEYYFIKAFSGLRIPLGDTIGKPVAGVGVLKC